MRVGLSLLNLVPGEVGGSERYAIELASELSRTNADVFAVVSPAAKHALAGLPVIAAGPPGGGGGVSKLRRIAFARVRSGALRRRLEGADVVHYPLTVPLPSVRVPWVTTLHDVQHHELPHLFPRWKRTYRALAYDRAARRADAVIVVSEFVRGRAIELLGLDAEVVHAVPHGVDHSLFRAGSDKREPFLLYPARAWPHKNHARLFEALELLRADRPELRLVLTGSGHVGSVTQHVESRGHISDAELSSLYRRAACLVFPSLYEGFGLPVLEAMASGCPVAASNRGALPEVCGGAAVLFDPEDPAAIAAAVREALERSGELSALGIERASGYTWARTARSHLSVYELVAASTPQSVA